MQRHRPFEILEANLNGKLIAKASEAASAKARSINVACGDPLAFGQSIDQGPEVFSNSI
jgi:hypothetical protein